MKKLTKDQVDFLVFKWQNEPEVVRSGYLEDLNETEYEHIYQNAVSALELLEDLIFKLAEEYGVEPE